MLIAFLLFANYLITAQRVLLVTNLLIVFGFALALFGLLQRFTWNGKFYWIREPLVPPLSPFGPFVNHNHFAGYVEMLLPLPLAMVWMKSIRPEQRLLYVAMTMLMGVAIFVSLSRGGMMSAVTSILFVALAGTWAQQRAAQRRGFVATKGDRRHLLMRFATLGLLLIVMAVGVWWMAAEPMMERMARTQLSGEAEAGRDTLQKSRGFIWQGTLKMIAAQPVLGVGFGAYETAYPQYSQHDSGVFPIGQAHNDYLQILADCGVVGGLLALWFIALLARAVWHGLQHQDARLAALSLGAGGGLCALLIHSLFDFNLQLPSNALLFLWLAALVSVLGVPSPASKSLTPVKTGQVGIRGGRGQVF
jgi:O-antigen ligase